MLVGIVKANNKYKLGAKQVILVVPCFAQVRGAWNKCFASLRTSYDGLPLYDERMIQYKP